MQAERAGEPWSEFLKNAVVWLVPALLVLPFYLVAIAISVAASDGGLLEASDGWRGRIFTALGPLLVLCGLGAAWVTARYGEDAEAYLSGGTAALVCIFVGILMSRRELHRLRGKTTG